MRIEKDYVPTYSIAYVKADYIGSCGYRVVFELKSVFENYPIIHVHGFGTRDPSVETVLVIRDILPDGHLSTNAEVSLLEQCKPIVLNLFKIMMCRDRRAADEFDMRVPAINVLPC